MDVTGKAFSENSEKAKKKPMTGFRITGFGLQRPERHCGECGFTAA